MFSATGRRLVWRGKSGRLKENATFSFEEMGPTRVLVSRSRRNAARGASSSSVVFARVVVEGCMRRVAARASCWTGGVYTGAEATVPDVRIFSRKLIACVSKPGGQMWTKKKQRCGGNGQSLSSKKMAAC